MLSLFCFRKIEAPLGDVQSEKLKADAAFAAPAQPKTLKVWCYQLRTSSTRSLCAG